MDNFYVCGEGGRIEVVGGRLEINEKDLGDICRFILHTYAQGSINFEKGEGREEIFCDHEGHMWWDCRRNIESLSV